MSMMKNMRTGINSAGMQFVLIAIIVTFVFWGIGGNTETNQTYASVGGKRITDTRVSMENAITPASSGDESGRTQQLIQSVIWHEQQLKTAKKMGFAVSDEEVEAALKDYPCGGASIPGVRPPLHPIQSALGPNKATDTDPNNPFSNCSPYFVENDTYSPKKYDMYLERLSGWDDHKFTERIREDLMIRKLTDLVVQSIQVSDIQVREQYAAQNTKLGISFVKIDREAVLSSIEISPEDAQAFIDASAETVQAKYDELLASRYTQQATAETSTISINLSNNAEEPTVLKKKLEDFRVQLSALSGADLEAQFAQLASEHSDDLSKQNGGERGVRSKAELGLDVSEAVFATEVGKLTEVVETNAGFELLYIKNKTDEVITPLEDVQLELAIEMLKEESFEDSQKKLAETLQKNWTENGDLSIETLDKYSLVKQIDPQVNLATRSVLELGPAPELIAAAQLVDAGVLLPNVFDIGGSKVVARVDSKEAPDMSGLANEYASIKSQLLLQGAMRIMMGWEADVQRAIPGRVAN